MFSLFRYKTPEEKRLAGFIRQHFGFYPSRIQLYTQAFLHKSSIRDDPGAHVRSNERLEFLGDALLDAIVAEYLFERFPGEAEGFLTKLKSKIVKRETLNYLGSAFKLEAQVRHTQFGMNNPKSLPGNAFEALIGAIYLDKGYVFAKKIVLEKVLARHLDIDLLASQESDYKSRILIWSQREKHRLEFVLVSENNRGANMQYEVEVHIDRECVARASAATKKEAEQAAARSAWDRLFPVQ